jgi:hypothetical protein
LVRPGSLSLGQDSPTVMPSALLRDSLADRDDDRQPP